MIECKSAAKDSEKTRLELLRQRAALVERLRRIHERIRMLDVRVQGLLLAHAKRRKRHARQK